MTPMENLRLYIIKRRDEMGMSQRDLAKLAELHHGTVAAIESGKVARAPSLDTLESLAKGLRIEPEVLILIARGKSPEDAAAIAGAQLRRQAVPGLDADDILEFTAAEVRRIEEVARREVERIRKERRASAESLTSILAAIPEDMENPPDIWELKTLVKIGALDGGELDPRSGSYFWQLPKEERRRRIIQERREWEEDQDDDSLATR